LHRPHVVVEEVVVLVDGHRCHPRRHFRQLLPVLLPVFYAASLQPRVHV